MPVALMMAVTLVTNYIRHRLGLTTLCQCLRAHVPKPLATVMVVGGFLWFLPHLRGGYPKR